jgi:hypothetical protein
MRQTSTTVIAIIFISLGAIGLLLSACVFYSNSLNAWHGDQYLRIENGASLLTKVGLIAVGILLVRRSSLARVLLACVLVLSCTDSVLVYLRFLPSMSPTLPRAAQVGRMIGHLYGLMLNPVLYLVVLAHLFSPQIRAEFGGTAGYPPHY